MSLLKDNYSIRNSNIVYFSFRRGTAQTLKDKNIKLMKNEIILELPNDGLNHSELEYLQNNKFKYKIGDGEHCWNELPYGDDKLPGAIPNRHV